MLLLFSTILFLAQSYELYKELKEEREWKKHLEKERMNHAK